MNRFCFVECLQGVRKAFGVPLAACTLFGDKVQGTGNRCRLRVCFAFRTDLWIMEQHWLTLLSAYKFSEITAGSNFCGFGRICMSPWSGFVCAGED